MEHRHAEVYGGQGNAQMRFNLLLAGNVYHRGQVSLALNNFLLLMCDSNDHWILLSLRMCDFGRFLVLCLFLLPIFISRGLLLCRYRSGLLSQIMA